MILDSYSIDLSTLSYSVLINKNIDNTKYKSDRLLNLIDYLHDYLGFPFLLLTFRLVSKEYNYNCCYFIYDFVSIDTIYIDSLINIKINNYITKYTIECTFNKMLLKLCFHMYAYNNHDELLHFIQNNNDFDSIFNIYSFQLNIMKDVFQQRRYLFIKATKRNTVLLFNEFILFLLKSDIFENYKEMSSKVASQIIIYTLINRIYHKHLYIKKTTKKKIKKKDTKLDDLNQINNLFKTINISESDNKIDQIPKELFQNIYEYLGVQGCVLLASTNKLYYNEIVYNVIYKLNIVKNAYNYLNLNSIFVYKNNFINIFKIIHDTYKYNNLKKIYIFKNTCIEIEPDKIKLLKLKKASPKLDCFMMNFMVCGKYELIKNRCCGTNSRNKRCLIKCTFKDKYCNHHKNQVTDIISKSIFNF